MDEETKQELDREIVSFLMSYRKTVEIINIGAKTSGTNRAVLIREEY